MGSELRTVVKLNTINKGPSLESFDFPKFRNFEIFVRAHFFIYFGILTILVSIHSCDHNDRMIHPVVTRPMLS